MHVPPLSPPDYLPDSGHGHGPQLLLVDTQPSTPTTVEPTLNAADGSLRQMSYMPPMSLKSLAAHLQDPQQIPLQHAILYPQGLGDVHHDRLVLLLKKDGRLLIQRFRALVHEEQVVDVVCLSLSSNWKTFWMS
ncbi:hypothetical protein BWQ96_04397 [Gracilariopsis chorda]|uniref:Uncharacterized protein n=1 Tax=Gracilariopsis chorda TaxID=448386 RepID=A0A2V3IXK0_9FLOR|nr:hypothetical protein BWQ96_04397 [Gracilariopsis chorda]|eukprot:PXF45860.1 hypothetical protein BWQ96_04397 [Gracilariopsis chorda]